ncbi:hypothetical protein K439DRAFT_1198637 [Ramaria rubella]|nr:hypothetical protein K439DRAFT_892090 [Ramaria rubella]KAF8583712.1 hypothetical protein K439DRAFT_1198637 [Ramaria rubella]
MKTIISIALFALAAVGVNAQGLIINTPSSIVECEPTQITFSGGTPPYFISILPGGQISAQAIENLPNQNGGTSTTWIANIAAGTPITFGIKDSTGATNFAAMVTIQPGSTSCLNSTGSASSGASTSGPASSSSPASSAASSGPASSPSPTSPATSAGSSASSSKASTTGASSTSSTASATPGSALALQSGPAAGIIGMLIAALLV